MRTPQKALLTAGACVAIGGATVSVPGGATVVRNGRKTALADLKTGDRVHISTSSEGAFVFAFDKSFRGFGDREGDHGPAGPGFRGGPPPGL